MCPIVAGVATALMSGAQAIAGYQGQKQQAEDTRRAAIGSHNLQSTEINRRQMQEEDATNQKVSLQNIEEAQLRAEAEVSGAAAGVSGASLDNILADVTRSASRNRETLRENSRATAQQLQLEKRGGAATAQSRINAAPKPSGLSLVAGLGSSAAAGYSAYNKFMG